LHNIEPHYHWRDLYTAEEDENSPFYGKMYSEFEYSNKIYNYLIHPQWDDFGSSTLFIKILFVDYDEKFAIFELIGEWNDCLQNDIMILKNEIIDYFQNQGISKFLIICENVLNFHGGDDDYYVELQEEISEHRGYVVLINLLDHVMREMTDQGLQQYVTIDFPYQMMNWRKFKPEQLCELFDRQLLAPYLTT
jgi:hypothetical protein